MNITITFTEQNTEVYEWAQKQSHENLVNTFCTGYRMVTSVMKDYAKNDYTDQKIKDANTEEGHSFAEKHRLEDLHHQILGNTINLQITHVSDNEFIMVQKLVLCLNKTRAENYEDWLKVGWMLRNIDSRLLTSWIEFSEVSSKYVVGECEKLWGKMKLDSLCIGSLHYWAKRDNYDEYKKISETNIVSLIDMAQGSNGAHYDVARVVHAIYIHPCLFTSPDTWYTFKNEKHRWVQSKQEHQLRTILSSVICHRFLERSIYCIKSSEKIDDEEKKDSPNKKAKRLQEIALKLKSSGYKDRVVKECKVLLCDEKFVELHNMDA